MLESACAQPLQDWCLRDLALVQQSVKHVAPLISLTLKAGGAAQVGLVSEHDEKFSLLAVGRVFHHPGRDLVRDRRLVRRATLINAEREAANAPIAITAAERKKIEQEIRRSRDGVNGRFEIIELSLYRLNIDKARKI